MKTDHLNFPQKIDLMLGQLESVRALLEKGLQPIVVKKNVDVQGAVEFLAGEGLPLSASSIYKLVSVNQIPFNRFGSKLIFDTDKLIQWCYRRMESKEINNQLINSLAKAANKKLNNGKQQSKKQSNGK